MKRGIPFLLFSVFFLSLVSAADTEIKIKTLPFHEVQIAIIKSASGATEVLKTFKQDADKYGDAKFTFSSSDSEFYINSFIKWNHETIFSKSFPEPFPAGTPVSLSLAPENSQLVETPGQSLANLAVNQTNSTHRNETNSSSVVTPPAQPRETQDTLQQEAPPTPVTGNSIASEFTDMTLPLNYIYYIVGGIIILAIIFFFFKIRKDSSKNFNFRPATKHEASNVMQLQRQLKDAQHEIAVLKNKDKIKAAEQKIEEDKKELERLRRGI